MTAIVQLQLNLWQQLEQAQAEPQATDWHQLCLAFDEAIDRTPVGQRLATAADAIEQMADVLAARASAWADDWYRQPGDGPVLGEDLFSEFVRQSFSLDLSDFVTVPELYVRLASEKSHEDMESVVEYREKADVLAELETFVCEGTGDEVEVQAYDEDIAAWAEAVRGWLKARGLDEVMFPELMNGVGLSVVKVWLALLLGGFRLEQRGGFYDAGAVAIAWQ